MESREMNIILKRGKGITRGKKGFRRDENCFKGMKGDG